jgi:S-(hydroxymethyl)glutathione dehydrogenase/alcohol dehydrogenase
MPVRVRALDALNTAKVEAGSTCAVFGAGMVGLGAVVGCRLSGAERIVSVDLSAERLELAQAHGATDTLVGGSDVVDEIVAMTDGFGADYTFEATGNVKVMRQAVEASRMGWGLCTIAGVAGKGETLDVVPRFLITGRRVAGSSFGGVKGATRCRSTSSARSRGRSTSPRSSRTASRSTTSTGGSS